jgi:hypothetical protein
MPAAELAVWLDRYRPLRPGTGLASAAN